MKLDKCKIGAGVGTVAIIIAMALSVTALLWAGYHVPCTLLEVDNVMCWTREGRINIFALGAWWVMTSISVTILTVFFILAILVVLEAIYSLLYKECKAFQERKNGHDK